MNNAFGVAIHRYYDPQNISLYSCSNFLFTLYPFKCMVLVKDQIITYDNKSQELDYPLLSCHNFHTEKKVVHHPPREIGLDKIEIKLDWIFSQGVKGCTPSPKRDWIRLDRDKIRFDVLTRSKRVVHHPQERLDQIRQR